LSANISEIKTVQIPKYNKAVQLKAAVAALQKQPIPVLTGEVDWLVVLNQIGLYQPSDAVLSTLSLQSTPPTAPATTPTSTTTPKSAAAASPAPAIPAAPAILGSITATINVPNLPSVTSWGQMMSTAPALTNVVPTGTLAPQPGVTFSAAMNIDGMAHSQRLSQFEEPLP
jgi:hypothetical protein